MSKLVPKVILEGTRLTFKTEIAFTLNEHPRVVGPRKYRYHSPVVSAEWCGFTNFPWGRGLVNYDPEEEALAMDTYATWAHLFENLRYYSWIVDRFHLSTRAWQLQHRGRDVDFGWLEERLDGLGFRLVLCSRSPESFAAARVRRLESRVTPGSSTTSRHSSASRSSSADSRPRRACRGSTSTFRTTTSPPRPTASPTGSRPPAACGRRHDARRKARKVIPGGAWLRP